MLFLIGLGLGNERDITLKGLDAIRSCRHVWLEQYTALLGSEQLQIERLEQLYQVPLSVADREIVEAGTVILEHARMENVALLVVGDPLAATTHTDLMLRAKANNIQVTVIHNASIMNAVAQCGLQLYKFGQTVSITFEKNASFIEKIATNTRCGFHTLCLLDIKVKEQTPENVAKNIPIYEKPRFMSVNQGIDTLFEALKVWRETQENEIETMPFDWNTPAFGIARLGHDDQKIASGTLHELKEVDFGSPLHSLVLAGPMHDIELDMFDYYHPDPEARLLAKQQRLDAERARFEAQDKQRRMEAADRLQRLHLFRHKKHEPVELSTVFPSPHATAAASDDEVMTDLEPF